MSLCGSAPDCLPLAARRSKRQLSQYFSSTDSALLWLRHCAQCLNSPRRSLPVRQSTGSILLSSYAALFIKEAGVYRVKRYPEANRNQDPASRQEPAISNELPPKLIDSISARVKFLGMDASLRISSATATARESYISAITMPGSTFVFPSRLGSAAKEKPTLTSFLTSPFLLRPT